MSKLHAMGATMVMGLALAGCAADGSPMLSTAALGTQPKVEKVATVDPICVALSNQIEALRKEESISGLEKAADGKGASVKVKREALAKQTTLNRTYAEFQTKCGPKLPAATSAQAPQIPAVAPIAAAPAAAKQ